MPIYEFRCKNCGSEFNSIMNFSDINQATCDNCNSNNIEKLISKIKCHNPDESFRKQALTNVDRVRKSGNLKDGKGKRK